MSSLALVDLLDRPVAFHRCFVDLTGDVKAALLLSQGLYWQRRAKQPDGWWYHTADEWQQDTGLSRAEVETARGKCKPYLLFELRDMPAVMYWHVDLQALEVALSQFIWKGESRLAERANLDSVIDPSTNMNTETNAETPRERPRIKVNDAMWDLLHGQEPTAEAMAAAQAAEAVGSVAVRLSAGLRLGAFPQTPDAQRVYKWIAEREQEGQALDAFVAYIMNDPRRRDAAWVYHKTPQYIKRDWPRAFPQAAEGAAPAQTTGTFYG